MIGLHELHKDFELLMYGFCSVAYDCLNIGFTEVSVGVLIAFHYIQEDMSASASGLGSRLRI